MMTSKFSPENKNNELLMCKLIIEAASLLYEQKEVQFFIDKIKKSSKENDIEIKTMFEFLRFVMTGNESGMNIKTLLETTGMMNVRSDLLIRGLTPYGDDSSDWE